MERSNGGERPESKCRKDKDHDLWYGAGSLAGFRRCAVCCTGVGSNSMFCKGCKHWVHKQCSGLKCLTEDPDYRCTRCQGTARPSDGRPQREVGPDKLEMVASFCYLGDMRSAAGSSENGLEEVQEAENISLFWPPFFQDTWPCVQLMCAERNAPCQ